MAVADCRNLVFSDIAAASTKLTIAVAPQNNITKQDSVLTKLD